MKYSIQHIVISLFLFCTGVVSGQTAGDAFELANQMHKEGDYSNAILEAKRAAFFSDSLKVDCYNLIATCYRETGAVDTAAYFMNRAIEHEMNDSLKQIYRFDLVHYYLHNDRADYALIELMKIPGYGSGQSHNFYLFYSSLAHFRLGNFGQSEKYATELLSRFEVFDSAIFKTIYANASKHEDGRGLVPAILSGIVPGSGQLVSGYYKEAANSFLLNAALISVTVIMFYQLYPLDVILTMYPFVRRYYISGIAKAGHLAKQRYERKQLEAYNQLLDYMDGVMNE